MPVQEHPVSEMTKRGDGYKYGCHSREGFADGYWAKNGLACTDDTCEVAGYRMTYVPHVMSEKCRSYDLWDTSPCEGCTAEKDYEFAGMWK